MLALVEEHLGITEATAGMLTGIPVLCFALAVPAATWLIRRAGLENAVAVSLAGVLAGTVLRSADGVPSTFAGTVLIGVAITVGNVAVPVIIGRDFPGSVGTVSGMYTAALNLGSVITATGTAPIAQAVGWRWALVSWSVLVLVAGLVWRVATRRLLAARGQGAGDKAPDGTRRVRPAREPGHPAPDAERPAPVWRRWDAWALVAAFGGQSFSYYGITAWLPTLLAQDHALSAQVSGTASAVFQLMGIAGALGAPALLLRRVPPRALTLVISALWFALPLGLLVAPGGFVVWMACAGAAQGAMFTVVITLMVHRSASQAESRRMSAMVQGLGYSIAALGAPVLGAVHGATGGWTAPLAAVLVALTLMTAGATAVASAGPRREPATS